MPEPTTQSASTEDVLTQILRNGAQELLAAALAAEVAEYLERYGSLRDDLGRRQLVRNGFLPAREVQTGIGPVPVRQPRVRDRGGEPVEPFESGVLPRYLRRTKSVEELIPWLYLKGISTGDFGQALAALLGSGAPGLSPTTIVRLKKVWERDFEAWTRRSLAPKRYVYFWVDGIYCNVRLEEDRQCFLVVMGATADGVKELVAVQDGFRESEQSWRELLLDLKARGLAAPPDLAVGDGALGFWKALRKVFPKTRTQRCWVHKTVNILNRLPRSRQPHAKRMLHDIWMAATRDEALRAFDLFFEAYEPKYPDAASCLRKDKEALLAFYDFPAEHWRHLHTTNPIESTFATVRLRTRRTKGCGSRLASLTMVFKLAHTAQARWRRLNGHEHLADVISGVRFIDGIKDAA
ncbi:MAG: IS256 family transposase [Planctomycetota bacterium]